MLSALGEFDPTDAYRFVAYFALAAIGATRRLKIVDVPVNISPSFAFVLIGISEFSLGEAMLMAIAATFMQCFCVPPAKRSRKKIVFNISAVAISLMVAYNPSHYFLSQDLSGGRWSLVLAALAYFVVNTGLVATMAALSEKTSIVSVWRYVARHTLAYYAVGGFIASLTVSVSRISNWRFGLAVIPLLYVSYLTYRAYLRRKGIAAV